MECADSVKVSQLGLAAQHTFLCDPSKKYQLDDRQHGNGHAKYRMGRMLFLCNILALLIVPRMHP